MGLSLASPKRVPVDHTTSPVMTNPRWRISTIVPTEGGKGHFTIIPVAETLATLMSVQAPPSRIFALAKTILRLARALLRKSMAPSLRRIG